MAETDCAREWKIEEVSNLQSDWRETTANFWRSHPGQRLWNSLAAESVRHVIFPAAGHVFRALELTPMSKVSVVILGQDPYHGPGEANGLAFSVPAAIRTPPSLRNILQELGTDLAVNPPKWLDLRSWADAGVLLLNTTLTVRQDAAGSHRGWGWEVLTDQVIRQVSRSAEGVVFILWGKDAQKKRSLVDENRHLVVASAHPSPLSAYRGFFGSRPFSSTNRFLEQRGRPPISWLS